MTMFEFVAAAPWAELFPQPWTVIASVVSTGIGYWYGFRHPQEF